MSLLESIMCRDLVVAAEGESVATAAQRLASREVGALLVVRGDRLVGILSERDVLRRVIAQGLDPSATMIREVSTPDPVAIASDTPLREGVRLIREHGFRHLPIVDRDRRPLGIISSRDLLQFTVEGLERYVERRRGAQHREELTDPYDSMSL
jgi:CBS domain-containing protein